MEHENGLKNACVAVQKGVADERRLFHISQKSSLLLLRVVKKRKASDYNYILCHKLNDGHDG